MLGQMRLRFEVDSPIKYGAPLWICGVGQAGPAARLVIRVPFVVARAGRKDFGMGETTL